MGEDFSSYDKFRQRYEEGQIPWNEADPPPEVMDVAALLPPGRVLDLGCGFGRASIYLARRGWQADGVDFIPAAIEEARRRADAAGAGEQVHFHVASAAALDFLQPPYDLAIDVGCMHSFDDETLVAYRDGLNRLLRPGALYLLHARLRGEQPPGEEGPRGIREEMVQELFAPGYALERAEHGSTQVEDRPPWQSAWYWYRKL